MYEDIAKQLRESCHDCKLWDGYGCCLRGDCTGQARLQAADAFEELNVVVRAQKAVLDKFPKWIPVTERLPDENDIVLITDSLNVGTGYLVHGYGWISPFDDIETSHVSHWMPLPETPEESET